MSDKPMLYYVKSDYNPVWVKVDLEHYCKAERMAGFHPKSSLQKYDEDGNPIPTPATGSFSANGIHGRSTTEELT